VDLADGGAGERAAAVLATALVTVVWAVGAVLNESAASAVRPAGAQLRVEGVQDFAVELAERQLAEQGADVVADVAFVGAASGVLDVDQFQVPVEELVHGGPGARVAALVDLGEETGACLLGFLGGGRARRDRLIEVEPSLGDRVDPRVHPHPE
jgi:hypothetical protein